jgi:hypothetical protein
MSYRVGKGRTMEKTCDHPAADQVIKRKLEDGPGRYMILFGSARAEGSSVAEHIDSAKLTSEQETGLPAVAIRLGNRKDEHRHWWSEVLVRSRRTDDPDDLGI